ncbi:MAG: Ig-like domain-containing protein, partial [Bacteroidota bacterium]
TSAAVSVTVNSVGGGLCVGVDAWDAAQVYNGGDQVQYNGRLYRAKYWTQNNNPETTDPWEQISRCDGYCGGLPEYLPGKAYTQGTEVIFGTSKYSANTWTTSAPGSADWTLSGSCDGTVPNVAPTVALSAPANNTQVNLGASVTITATASDSDGTVASVEFLVDGVAIGTDATAPYSVDFAAATAGTYSLTARATDDDGATATSTTVTLVVNNPDVDNPPSVSISNPASGTTLDAGSTITLSANATDDNAVTSVAFFANGTSLGTDATAPYSISWNAATPGTYSLTAVATDDAGQTATSAEIVVTVNASDTGGCDLPEFVLSQVYSSGDRVQYQGNEYRATTTIHSVYPNSTVSLASGWWVDEGLCGPVVIVNAPSNLSVGSATTSSLALSWVDNSDNEQGFKVLRDGAEVASLAANSTSYTDAGLNAGTSYSYTVVAYQGATESSSNVASGATLSDPNFVAAPTGLSAQATSTSQINLSWTDNATNETGYVVERGGVVVATLSANASSYSDTGLAEATTYTYQVRATGASADSEYSNSTSATTRSSGTSDRLLVGYWHNFLNNSVDQANPLRLSDVSPEWDHINVSFGEPTFGSTANIDFVLDNAIYPGATGEQEFKNDIAALQAAGKKVVLSIGGANGTVILETTADRDAFVSSVVGLIQEYGFDGMDIDFEGSSMALQSGDYDYENPTTPSVVNLISATQSIIAQSGLGSNFVLTMAPETFYVQGGASSYGSGGSGAYLPLIHALRSQMDFIHVQHYNTGCMIAPDGQCYSSANVNFHAAMADMLLAGFDINSPAGKRFQPLREDQVLIGLPASPQAAGSGYTSVADVQAAVDYLITGNKPAGATYNLQNPAGYPGFRGLMTWSINWDRFYNFEFSSNYRPFLDSYGPLARGGEEQEDAFQVALPLNFAVYPNPVSQQATLALEVPSTQWVTLDVLNTMGQQVQRVFEGTLATGQHRLVLDASKYASGLYHVRVVQGGQVYTLPLLKE